MKPKQATKEIYIADGWEILSKKGIRLACGSEQEMRDLHEGRTHFGSYYSDCELAIRQQDIFCGDNRKHDSLPSGF